ncbi:MAG: hypothetical protein Q4F23_05540 [Coriobacteriia bacterium]|nr:hypothetical protein [Coriobacteriia bacterium]
MFTSTIIVEFVVGTACLVAAILLFNNGKHSRTVQAQIEGPGERPGAYFVVFERDGKHFRANYKSKKPLEAGDQITLTINDKHVMPNNWKIGAGLCLGLAVFDYAMAIFGIVS